MTTQRILTTIDQAIHTHMLLIEHHLVDMLENINEARHALNHRSRNGAVGTLLQCKEAYTQIGALYEAIIALHHHSDVIERPEE
jgi:hypothetical protein